MSQKNEHAVALGRLGGKAGKGSDARRKAALKANKHRWLGHTKRSVANNVPNPVGKV